MGRNKPSEIILGAIIGGVCGIISSIGGALITSNTVSKQDVTVHQADPFVVVQNNPQTVLDVPIKPTYTQEETNDMVETSTENINQTEPLPNTVNSESNFNIFSNFKEVQGNISNNNITLYIKKSLSSIDSCLDFPKQTWGLNLYFEDEPLDIGDIFLIVEVKINSDYSIKNATFSLGRVVDNEGNTEYSQQKISTNELKTSFDGERYIISGDISNEFISDTMFIGSHFYYS